MNPSPGNVILDTLAGGDISVNVATNGNIAVWMCQTGMAGWKRVYSSNFQEASIIPRWSARGFRARWKLSGKCRVTKTSLNNDITCSWKCHCEDDVDDVEVYINLYYCQQDTSSKGRGSPSSIEFLMIYSLTEARWLKPSERNGIPWLWSCFNVNGTGKRDVIRLFRVEPKWMEWEWKFDED